MHCPNAESGVTILWSRELLAALRQGLPDRDRIQGVSKQLAGGPAHLCKKRVSRGLGFFFVKSVHTSRRQLWDPNK